MIRTMQSTISLLALALLAAGCRDSAAPSNPLAASAATAATAPAESVTLQVFDYNGIEELIASKRGKVVVMDAWSTSCPPCLKEFPNLVAMQKKLGRDRLACISLSFDYEGIGKPADVRPKVLKFLESQQATLDNVLCSEESDVLYRRLKLTSVPAVFVYDRAGKLVKRFDNEDASTEADAFSYEQVESLVVELLEQPAS